MYSIEGIRKLHRLILCKPLLLISLVTFIFLPVIRIFPQSANSPFFYTLPSKASTSAGIYKTDGTLIKTLWSGISRNPGKYQIKWDGTDDDGKVVSKGKYIAKVLSNNVKYEWEGVVGNTSNAFDPGTLYHSYQQIQSMAVSGRRMFMAIGYNEQGSTGIKSTINNPQKRTEILSKGGVSEFVASDSINVYWSCFDANDPSHSWVYVTKVSDDNEANLTNAVNVATRYGMTYRSSINVQNTSSARITGLAVQQSGKYLFVSHQGIDKVSVVNKTTGEIVRTFSVSKPRNLAVDDHDNLWVISKKNTITKYHISSNGTLSTVLMTLKDVISPIAIAAKGNMVLVADRATQRIVSFNSSTGLPGSVLGTTGGYAKDPTVNNNKFYWKDARKNYSTYIAFQPDGSFWVGDPGNSRSQHYNSDFSFINRIMYLPASYSSSVDPNNITRVFSDYLEFKIDYSKPLSGTNGSWKLVKNWGATVPENYDDQFGRFKDIATLSNGRTYASFTNQIAGVREIAELPPNGNLRFTGVTFPNDNTQFYPDGSLRRETQFTAGKQVQWTRKLLTGFDNAHNPAWGMPNVIATSPNTTEEDPYYWGNPTTLSSGEITSSNLIISFDGGLPPYGGKGYHLGAIRAGDNKWLWRTARSTFRDYNGPFPSDGSYDIGNGVQYAGSKAMAIDHNIIWGYHGEFWKASQTNMYTHVYDDGLFIGQFGATGVQNGLFYPGKGNAGNALTPRLVKDAQGNLYLYHSDESYHSGIHRWRISGLNTIKEQSISLTSSFVPSSEDSSLPGIDLMAGLPFNSVLKNNSFGWTRNPVDDEYTSYDRYWSVKTSVKTYEKRETDLWIKYQHKLSGYSVTRDLGINSNLAEWKLSGKISYDGSTPNLTGTSMYFDVLDDKGKIITRFYIILNINRDEAKNSLKLVANNQLVAEGGLGFMMSLISQFQPIEISMLHARLKIKYANFNPLEVSPFDSKANISNPRHMQVNFDYTCCANNYTKIIDFSEMRFLPVKSLNYYKSKKSGSWNSVSTWLTSNDNVQWKDARYVPDTSAGTIIIQNQDTVTITDTAFIDQLNIRRGGSLRVAPKACLLVNDGPGEDVTVEAGGSLVIESNSKGTGEIGRSSGSISGAVTVEKYIDQSYAGPEGKWRLVTVPLEAKASPTIFNSWQEAGVYSKSFGTNITVGTLPNRFDYGTTAKSTILVYHTAQNRFLPLASTNIPITTYPGYFLHTLETQTTNLSVGTVSPAKGTTLRATGLVRQGDQEPVRVPARSFQLIGNPFPSKIDWSLIALKDRSNILNRFYVWDSKIGGSSGVGNYVMFDASVGFIPDNPGGSYKSANTLIQSGQAFFVQSTSSEGSITLREGIKGGRKLVESPTNNQKQILRTQLLGVQKGIANTLDGVISVFSNDGSKAVTNEDANNMPSLGEDLSISRNDIDLTLEHRPLITSSDTVFLNLKNMFPKSYRFKFTPQNFQSTSLQAYLIDKFLGTSTQIDLTGDTEIDFNLIGNPISEVANRFCVVYRNNHELISSNSFKGVAVSEGIQINWTQFSKDDNGYYLVERSGDGKLFTAVATIGVIQNSQRKDLYTWSDYTPLTGRNFYRLKLVDSLKSIRHASVLIVNKKLEKRSISIFPNPFGSSDIRIRFQNIPAGTFEAELIAAQGQVVVRKIISYGGGAGPELIPIGATLNPGTYFLRIKGKNLLFSKKLLK